MAAARDRAHSGPPPADSFARSTATTALECARCEKFSHQVGARPVIASPTVMRVVVLLFSLASCVRVQAHQRETLARSDMELGAFESLSGGEDHARSYREGSSGGATTKAGGCGCN
ncbi:MAG: DUF4266 domain-containing protein [Kofleriaceae bacterium]